MLYPSSSSWVENGVTSTTEPGTVKWCPQCTPSKGHAEGGASELHLCSAQSSAQLTASTQQGRVLSTIRRGWHLARDCGKV